MRHKAVQRNDRRILGSTLSAVVPRGYTQLQLIRTASYRWESGSLSTCKSTWARTTGIDDPRSSTLIATFNGWILQLEIIHVRRSS